MEKRYGESLDDWNAITDEENHSDHGDLTRSDIAEILYKEACRLDDEKRSKEALCLINVAIENDETIFEYYMKKGVILENLNRFKDSADAYDRALDINENDGIYENKARMLYRWANSLNDKKKALELIDEAIEILPTNFEDRYIEKFWYLKGSILDCLGQPIESRKCYLMAEGFTDEIKRLDDEVDFLRNSADVLINITGTRFYHGLEAFKKGMVVNLIRENDNEHDPDAIRVELNGETLGYVANNEYTLIENVKSATEIRSLKYVRAEVVLIYLDEYVIAKLIE